MDFVAAIKIRQAEGLRGMLREHLGEPDSQGVWDADFGLKDIPRLKLRLGSEWLVAGDTRENLAAVEASVRNQVPGWGVRPAFRRVARQIDESSSLFLFVDTQVLIKSMEPLKDVNPNDKLLASLPGPIGYAVVPYDYTQVRIDVFCAVNPPPGSELESFFENTRGGDPRSGLTAFNLPWDAANVFAVDYPCAKELLDATVALIPEVEQDYDRAQDMFAGYLGLDAEQGFDKLIGGRLILSVERIDTFLNIADAYLDASDGLIDSSEPSDSFKSLLPRIPASFAFQMPVEANQTALIKGLRPYIGQAKAYKELFGVKLYQGKRKLVSYAQDGEWVYLAGGRTERLVRNMLKAAKGRKQSLGSLNSWASFSVRPKGRLLIYGHQKVDAYYSILKGLILVLGAEFRPIAQEFGRVRDYHSAATVIPDGFLITGEILHGDGR